MPPQPELTPQLATAEVAALTLRERYPSPAMRYGDLYRKMCRIPYLPDGILHAYLEPKSPDAVIMDDYAREVGETPPGEKVDVIPVVERHFHFPRSGPNGWRRRPELDIEKYVDVRLQEAIRSAPTDVGNQIGLPDYFMGANGRFDPQEEGRGLQFYWDSYWSVRGAAASGNAGIVRSTLNNFAHCANQFDGLIPNYTGTESLGRTQPAVFARTVRLLEALEGPDALVEYLEPLIKHHAFLTDASGLGDEPSSSYRRVVRLKSGEVAGRCYDDGYFDREKGEWVHPPRDEMLDVDEAALREFETHKGAPATQTEKDKLFLDRAAACEAGTDFSCDLYKDGENAHTIHTTDLILVMTNALIYETELTIAAGFMRLADITQNPVERAYAFEQAKLYRQQAAARRDTINNNCRTPDRLYANYDFVEDKLKDPKSILPIVFALSTGIAPEEDASYLLDAMDAIFSTPAGLITTLYGKKEQWDSWVWPLVQMEAIDAAILHGRYDLALKWCETALATQDDCYAANGFLAEKSDPNNPSQPGDGGEYECVKDLTMSLGVNAELRRLLPWLREMAAGGAVPSELHRAAGHLSLAGIGQR